MEAVRQIVDSTLLKDIVTLPKGFQNKKVEVIVLLQEEKAIKPILTGIDINSLLKGSLTESLIGAIPQSNLTLDDYRAERLVKYDRTN